MGGNGLQAGALVSKGGAALGTQFRAGMYTNYFPSNAFVSFISIMGTEAGTILTINNIDENVDLVDIDEVDLGSNAFNKLNDIIVSIHGQDLLSLDLSDIKKNIKSDGWIKDAKIKKSFPLNLSRSSINNS